VTFVNKVKEAENESEQKPVVTQWALIAVDEADGDKFTNEMERRLPDSYNGALEMNLNGWLVGWMSYTARGANITDIKRRIEKTQCEAHVFPITRVVQWDAE
jgi:hypothetical protein